VRKANPNRHRANLRKLEMMPRPRKCRRSKQGREARRTSKTPRPVASRAERLLKTLATTKRKRFIGALPWLPPRLSSAKAEKDLVLLKSGAWSPTS